MKIRSGKGVKKWVPVPKKKLRGKAVESKAVDSVDIAEFNEIFDPITRTGKMGDRVEALKEDLKLRLQDQEKQIATLTKQLNGALERIESERKKFEELLSCDICCELLRIPHMFPTCGHTFCMQCIAGLGRKNNQRGIELKNIRSILCPTCRNQAGGNVVKNYIVLSLVEAFSDNEDTKIISSLLKN